MRDFFVTRTSTCIVATGLVLLAAYLTAMTAMRKPDGRVIFGDATHHFVQLRSLVFDRDLDFRDEYTRIYCLHGNEADTDWVFTELTPTGHVRNYMPIGPALLWAPMYIAVATGQWLLSLAGLAARPDGFDRSLQLVPGIMGVLSATAAAWLSWRAARRWASPAAAAAGVFGVWLGSHALYYSLASPSYSHTASMLTASLLVVYWLDVRDALTATRLAALGALCGLCALMRWQDAIFLLLPLVDACRWPAPLRRRAAGLAAMAAGFLIAFSPQMAVWTVLYGQPLALPQGPSFMRWTSPHMWLVLFSDGHGLFPWAPILVPAVIGLAALLRRDRSLLLPVGLVLLVSWYTNAAVADWWAGEAFGARRFLSLFPLFVAGLAVWLQPDPAAPRVRPLRLALAVVLGVANGFLLLQYEVVMKGLTDVAPYPHGWPDMWVTRFVVPFRLIGRWLR